MLYWGNESKFEIRRHAYCDLEQHHLYHLSPQQHVAREIIIQFRAETFLVSDGAYKSWPLNLSCDYGGFLANWPSNNSSLSIFLEGYAQYRNIKLLYQHKLQFNIANCKWLVVQKTRRFDKTMYHNEWHYAMNDTVGAEVSS